MRRDLARTMSIALFVVVLGGSVAHRTDGTPRTLALIFMTVAVLSAVWALLTALAVRRRARAQDDEGST